MSSGSEMLRVALLLGAAVSCLAAGLQPELDMLRFNQIQGIATSKSFHLAPADSVLNYLTQKDWAGLAELQIPQAFKYDHRNITEQLNMGITNLEIWVMDDYMGGLYAQSAGLKLSGANGNLSDPSLMQPGYKLLQMADWDYNSTVFLLDNFITEVLAWSTAHVGHLPLTIVVHPATSGITGDVVTDAAKVHLANVKLSNSNVPGPKKFTVPQALGDGTAFNATTDLMKFDATLRNLIPAAKLYTPDNLRMGNATLRDAVFPPNATWPTIGELRNKILIVADPGFLKDYNMVFPNLTNAVMFTSDDTKSDDPNVVFLDVEVDLSVISGIANTFSLSNNISKDANAKVDAGAVNIRAKVEAGFMVRTAVDKNLVEQNNNYDYRYKVFAAVGGAHWVMTSTEFVQTRLIPGSNYSVNSATVPGFAGRAMICNPVTTNIFAHNFTSPANGSTVATVACPYKATLPAGIVLPASGTVTPQSSSATAASASLSFLAIVAASVLLLSW